MQSQLGILFNRIFGITYSTEGFFDEKGNCLFADEIINRVIEMLGDNVAAIYLIGSVLRMQGRNKAPYLPHDIDVFVRVKDLASNRHLGKLYITVNGVSYPVHWLVYDCHPFDVYIKYGNLKQCFDCLQIYPNLF